MLQKPSQFALQIRLPQHESIKSFCYLYWVHKTSNFPSVVPTEGRFVRGNGQFGGSDLEDLAPSDSFGVLGSQTVVVDEPTGAAEVERISLMLDDTVPTARGDWGFSFHLLPLTVTSSLAAMKSIQLLCTWAGLHWRRRRNRVSRDDVRAPRPGPNVSSTDTWLGRWRLDPPGDELLPEAPVLMIQSSYSNSGTVTHKVLLQQSTITKNAKEPYTPISYKTQLHC